jgi:predicted metal-dependent HD superfamily phosphohydrolase
MKLDQSLEYLGASIAMCRNWYAALREPHRRYHTLAHVEAMLSNLPDACASRELVAAIWLHDIVYDPQADDNEERSADRALIDLAYTSIDRQAVRSLILGTRRHEGGSDSQNILNDLDLGIFGAPRAVYIDYVRQIREEYGHVNDEVYRPARAAIMRRFNERHIFRTRHFEHLEAPAHVNLAWEIKALTA